MFNNKKMIANTVVLTFLLSVIMVGSSNAASIGEMVKNLTTDTAKAVSFISIISYVTGAAIALMGILDLKTHIEAPDKAPIKKGLGKLGVGALLVVLPFAIRAAQESMGATATDNYQSNLPAFNNQ